MWRRAAPAGPLPPGRGRRPRCSRHNLAPDAPVPAARPGRHERAPSFQLPTDTPRRGSLGGGLGGGLGWLVFAQGGVVSGLAFIAAVVAGALLLGPSIGRALQSARHQQLEELVDGLATTPSKGSHAPRDLDDPEDPDGRPTRPRRSSAKV